MSEHAIDSLFGETGFRTRWQENALCREIDPDIFFPSSKAYAQAAQRVCQLCPVKTECLDDELFYAKTASDISGVRAGLDENQRRRLFRSGKLKVYSKLSKQDVKGSKTREKYTPKPLSEVQKLREKLKREERLGKKLSNGNDYLGEGGAIIGG